LHNHKGQIAPAILMGAGIILLIFTFIIIFVINQQSELRDTEDFLEKRNECFKIANLINSVYIAGHGAQVQTTTNYIITIYNYSQIHVGNVASIEEIGMIPKIAFLASEAGASTEEFYNQVNEQLDPDPVWYKVCFSDMEGPGCSYQESEWINDEIDLTINDLMNNLDDYNTIYLEDPTMYYGNNYIELLEDWVSQGNALILSEHVMCRDTGGNGCPTCYQCGEINNDDEWEIFGVKLNQESSAWGWDYYPPYNFYTNVIVNDSDESFDLIIGDELCFEERSYIENQIDQNLYEAENLELYNGYSSATSCTCSSPSNGECARHRGSVGNEAIVVLSNFQNPSGQYQVVVRYCDESDDGGHPDEYTLYVNGNPVNSWQSSNGYGSGQIWVEESTDLTLSTGDEISVGAIKGGSSTYARLDWIDIISLGETENQFKTIARYKDYYQLGDSRNQPAIAYWDYGDGKVFYFGDFQVEYINLPEKDFSVVLANLISTAYYLVAHPGEDWGVSCYFSAFSENNQVYGDIVIRNENNNVIIENASSS